MCKKRDMCPNCTAGCKPLAAAGLLGKQGQRVLTPCVTLSTNVRISLGDPSPYAKGADIDPAEHQFAVFYDKNKDGVYQLRGDCLHPVT